MRKGVLEARGEVRDERWEAGIIALSGEDTRVDTMDVFRAWEGVMMVHTNVS